MKINDLITMIDDGYPDSMIVHHWDFDKECPVSEVRGDTLALFICREIEDTFGEGMAEVDQLRGALRVVRQALDELHGLEEYVCTLIEAHGGQK